MRLNYVLVDYENVRPGSAELLADECFRLIVFVGASQAKIPFEFAASVQRIGCRAEYVRISGNGPNALDFHIAYHVGRLSATEPTAFFHIISKDSGFDPLIEHLKGRGVWVRRSNSIGAIPIVSARSAADRVEFARDRLRRMGKARPRSPRALDTVVAHMFSGRLAGEEVSAVVRGLIGGGLVSVSGDAVAYAFPPED